MQPVIWNTCHILFQAHMSSLIYLMILISECIQNRTDYHLAGVKSKTRRNYSNGHMSSLIYFHSTLIDGDQNSNLDDETYNREPFTIGPKCLLVHEKEKIFR